MKTFAALIAAGVATSATAQQELNLCVEEVSLGTWNITAELLNPTGTVRAAVANLGFIMNGTDLANFSYNAAFDSDFFGPATVNSSATEISFVGQNTLPPLNNQGGPDGSNPLFIGQFNATTVDSFVFDGQTDGALVGAPFDTLLTYNTAVNTDGDTPYTIEIKPIPAPASAALLGLGGLAAVRRRR